MKFLDYQGLQEYDALIKQYIQDNIPDSSQAADVATALKNAANPNSTIKIAICTQAEYNALQNPESNVLYIISDETSEVVNVEANPSGTATTGLTKIRISNVIYSIPQIEANPTLSGNETTLQSIGINGTNYAIPSGGGSGSEVHLYEHVINAKHLISGRSDAFVIILKIISTKETAYSKAELNTFLATYNPTYVYGHQIQGYPAAGVVSYNYQSSGTTDKFYNVCSVFVRSNKIWFIVNNDSRYPSDNCGDIAMNRGFNDNYVSLTDTVTQIF